ncbi:hypothetical protein [Streptomyces sp. NPDC002889]|uniref:hypothetical protein n=1 Tax=Streptomyces sp. NPDC002889 TaxID=3364669 RepID=UPI0036BED55E
MALSARSGPALLRVRNGSRTKALLFLAFALAAVSACSSDRSADNDPKASPTPSATKSADPTETAKNEAIGAYRNYWQQMEKTFASGTSEGTDLKKYAAATALIVAEDAAKNRHAKGQMMTGSVTVENPTVTKIDIDRKVPSTTLSSCLDITRWNVVERADNKPVPLPSQRLTRYVIVSTVEKWPDGWKVIKDEPQAKPC